MGRFDDLTDAAVAKPAPAVPAPRFDDLTDAAVRQRRNDGAALAVTLGADANPDRAAEAMKLARRYNMPPAVTEQFVEDYKARAKTEDARRLFEKSPALGAWVDERPEHARIAHDDLSMLSGLEAVLRSYGEGVVGQGAGSILSGAGRLYDIAARGLAAPLLAVGVPDVQIPAWASPAELLLKAPGRYLKQAGRDMGPAPEARNFATDVAGGLGQMTAQVAAYLASGGTAGTAMLYAGGADSMAEKVLPDSASQAAKDTATVGGAIVTGVTEKYALDKILGPLAVPVKNAIAATLARLGVAAAAEGGQELAESIGQDALRKVLTNSDAEIDIPGAAYEGGVGATVGGIVRGIVEAALHVKRRGAVQQQQQAGSTAVEQAVTLAAESKLRERDPQAFAELVQKTAGEAGAPTEVYIDARQIAEALQQGGYTIEQAQAALPSMADQFATALDTGGDVVLPLGEFAAGVAGSPLEQVLMQHVRTEPDALSPAEAKKTGPADEQMKAEAERAAGAVEAQQADTSDRDAVRQSVFDQLQATGRMTADVNSAYADATALIFANLARREGVSAAELWKRYDLKINASGAFGAVLQQRAPDAADLLVQHNLTVENLLHSVRMGGIPVPSLAVTKKDAPMTNFGEITLIGPKEMADPKGYAGAKVFGADIYSPRYPSVEFKLDAKAERALNSAMEPFRKDGDRKLYADEARRPDDIASYKPFKRWAADRNGVSESDLSWQQMKESAAALMRQIGAGERIFQGFTNSGNRRYIDHTLDNVVKILKKELRGGENFNYGVGSLRAKFTPQFRSLEQIRKAKGRLMNKASFDALKKEVDSEFVALAEDLDLSLEQTVEVIEDAAKMGAKRAINRALKDYKRDGSEATDEQAIAVGDFARKLVDLPTEYFEAKILRAVDLAEFAAAVVPSNAPQEVLDALAERGVKRVTTYDPAVEGDRKAKIAGFSDLFFQEPLAPSTPTPEHIALLKREKVLTRLLECVTHG